MIMHQMTWASVHDWFVGSLELIGGDWMVIVEDHLIDTKSGERTRVVKEFTSFKELKAWAGY